jgi:hypothetical protein
MLPPSGMGDILEQSRMLALRIVEHANNYDAVCPSGLA